MLELFGFWELFFCLVFSLDNLIGVFKVLLNDLVGFKLY